MITAAIPTYNNANILWLQLESLCNQVNAPEWELIMCEEESDNTFGAVELHKYAKRLKEANCQRIVYLKLSNWIPLGQKWIVIRDNMHKDSIGMMLCASDNHSSPFRIADTYNDMLSGYDWTQWNKGHFYNIVDYEAGLFEIGENNPALFMCVSKACLDRVNETIFPTKGVDSWLMKSTRVTNVNYNGITDGIHTDGCNTISHNRRSLYKNNASGCFKIVDADKLFAKFPAYIQEKLLTLRK